MAFRELTENEVNMLNERQKQLYMEELELYRERCALVDRIEVLENVKYPEIKPKYVFLSKIKASKVNEIRNIEEPKVIIDKVFSPEMKMIKGKENVGQLENVITQLGENYRIKQNGNIFVAKTIDNQFDIPNNEKVKLPIIDIEDSASKVSYSFKEVKISDIPEVVTEADVYINEMKYEKIEVESNISIDTSHPKVEFNLEEINDVNVDLSIKDNYVSPNILEFDEVEAEIRNTKVFLPEEEAVEIELPKKAEVEKEEVLIAKADAFKYDDLDEVQLIKLENTVLETPVIEVEFDNENNIELTNVTNFDVPKTVDIVINDSDVSIEKTVIATPNVGMELNFEEKIIEKDINAVVSEANVIEFSTPELIINENKINIERPMIVDKDATDKIMQIINGMGVNYEE